MKTAKKARGKSTSRGETTESNDLNVTSEGQDTVQTGNAQLEADVMEVERDEPKAASAPAVEAQRNQDHDEDEDDMPQPSGPNDHYMPRSTRPSAPVDPLNVRLSAQLHNKLVNTARDEGVSLEALVQELLAEGVTLRAWEIIERKSAMRGGNANQQPGNNNRNFNNQGGRHNNNNHRGGGGGGGNHRGGGGGGGGGNQPRRQGGGPNNAWMEDKAAFLEYVRNQEKRRR